MIKKILSFFSKKVTCKEEWKVFLSNEKETLYQCDCCNTLKRDRK